MILTRNMCLVRILLLIALMIFKPIIGKPFVHAFNSLLSNQNSATIVSFTTSLPTQAPGTSSLSPHQSDSESFERSFVAVKPDGVYRGLIGEVISRFERKGLRLVAIKIVQPSEELAKEHYSLHLGKSFFPRLVHFFTSGPIVAMVWEGSRAISLIRKLVGETHPEDATPGTIRGDFAFQRGHNIVHSSDSPEAAEREIRVWFSGDELSLSRI